MTFEVFSLAITVVAVAACAVMAVVLARSRRIEGPPLDASAVIEDLKMSVSRRDGSLDAQIAELNSKLAVLQDSVTGREAALDKQVQGIGAQVRTVTALFTNDRARGGWGEISLLNIFEMAGLSEGRDYTAQFNAGGRVPDAVVHLPGRRKIVIDAKFPVARYGEAVAAADPETRNALLAAQGRELERVARELAQRGYGDLASGGYVVMYLPSQSVYEAAAEAHGQLIENLMRKRVIIAGPTSLFALLLHAGSLLSEHRAIRQSDEVLDAARELRGRMATFVDHLHAVQSSLAKTVTSFNSAVGSWTSRVSPQLDRISELSGQQAIGGLEPIDEAVREVPLETAHADATFN